MNVIKTVGKGLLRSIVMFLFVNLLPLHGSAEISYHYRYLTIDQGLSQNTVNAIIKDRFGYMWFATGNGLSKYDGYAFVTVGKTDLPSNLVNSLAETPDKRLWIGTSEGLAYFDQQKEEIIKFALAKEKNRPVNIISLFSDNQGRLWVGTLDQGLFLLSKKEANYEVIQYDHANSPLPGNSVMCFLQTTDGRILIGTNHGIGIADKQQQGIYLFKHAALADAYVLTMMESKEGDLWVGTINGAWVINPLSNRNDWHRYNPFAQDGISHSRVNHIAQDFKGNIYLGTLGGLNVYQPNTNSFQSFPVNQVDQFSLNSMFIKCIYADDEGNVWIGTDKGGINQFSLYQKPFHYLIHQEINSNSLSNNNVNSILSDGDLLWIGTAGGGLNKYDRKKDQFTHFKHNPGNATTISNNYVTAILKSDDDALWVGTWGGGLCKMMPNGTFRTFIPPVANAETNYQNAFVSSLMVVGKELLFIGTEGGLAIMNINTEQFIELNRDNNALTLLNEIGCMLIDKDNMVWVGTRTGLYNFSIDKINLSHNAICPENQLKIIQTDENASDANRLPGNYIISLLEDKEGNIWIGTYGDGVTKCTKTNNQSFLFETYSVNEGLSNNVIYAIQQDDPGYIWVSTDYGLSRINPKNRFIDNYFSDDGLLNDQFYWSASHKTATGELLFGSINGINHFFPTSFPVYPYKPKVTISDIKIFSESVKVGAKRYGKVVLQQPLFETNEISLSYQDNVFTLEFTALDYFHTKKIRYAYQLEGVDRDWVEVGSNQRSATYTNLNGGSYVFRVKATNSEGLWSDEEKKLLITIRPPFWKTNWFLFLVLMLVVALALVYLRYHTRRLLLEKTKLEKMVQKRTHQINEQNEQMHLQAEELQQANTVLNKRRELIEGQKKELEEKNSEIVLQRDRLVTLNKEIESINQTRLSFFTNISHEFRTPLTLIISPVERILKEIKLPENAHHLLMSVQRNARRLNLLIDQLLMFRKIETGNLIVRISNEDLTGFFSEVFHAFDVLANTREIHYSLRMEIDKKLRWYDSEKMEYILYNLLSNAFKYTPMGGAIEMAISEIFINKEGKEVPFVSIEIKDTGIGIEANQLEKIFDNFYRSPNGSAVKGTGIGLSLTKELVDALNGRIEVKNNTPSGVCFIVSLPVCKEDFTGAEIKDIPVYDSLDFDNKVQVVADNWVEDEPFMDGNAEKESNESLILIVEDNKELALFIANSLSGNYRVMIAENGKVGYEMARKQSPDLIISDVIMPVMNGVEMCRQIKNNIYTSHIPVILLSAKALLEDQLTGFQMGADDYISKPFNLDLLKAKINNAIDSRRKMKALFVSSNDLAPLDVQSDSLDDKFHAKAFEVLETNYSNPEFSVELFSDMMFVSRSLLYKKLKALVDLSPNDFITVYRLKKALPLLAAKDISVNEVAYSVGFNDPKYFSRVFKKFYKKTPSEYHS